MQTNYGRGTKFEHMLKRKYESMGYSVHRMAGSHSPIDLIAINGEDLILIQCKSSSIEELPNVKDLLKPVTLKEVRTKQQGQWIKVQEEQPSNVKLLEDMNVPLGTFKYIIWKGKGLSNYYTFQWQGIWDGEKPVYQWKARKGLPI